MRLTYSIYELTLRHVFTISRSSRARVPVVIVKLEDNGLIGYGEASPNSRYGETADSVMTFLNRVDLTGLDFPPDPAQLSFYLNSLSPHNPSARAAVDIAVHDLLAKQADKPLYAYLGIDRVPRIVSSFTIGIDSVGTVREKAEEAHSYPILKIKVGGPNDEDIIAAVRSVTDKPIRVDVNEGWKSKEEALEKINWLATQNVELIEQPMPADQDDDIRWLRQRAGIPIIADEALDSADSLAKIADSYDGINVKVQKLGGLYNSKRIIEEARQLGMKVMIGCMIESSVGIAAAAHLAPLADWIDLDGNVLITNDPFKGLENRDGEISLSSLPGLGVVPAS